MERVDARGSGRLEQVGDDVWAWVATSSTWGWSNAGLVAGDGRSALVDTLYDLHLTRTMLDVMDPVLQGRPLSDAVNTHGNGDHCFGNQLLGDDVRIHAGAHVARSLEAEAPALLSSLLSEDLGPVLGPYLRARFGAFDLDGITVRGPDASIEAHATLDVGGRALRLLALGPAHTEGDVAVHVPDAGVVFTGDLLFAGGTPVMWAGPLEQWVRACDALSALDAAVVVPGHGPLSDGTALVEQRAYLAHVRDRVRAAFAAGHSWQQAGDEIDLDRFSSLPDAERVVVTAHTEYRHLDPDLPVATPLELFTRMAQWSSTRGAVPATAR